MSKHRLKDKVQRLFSLAQVDINGDHAWDIQVHNEDFYQRMLRQGSLGLGESYMDGWWDARELDQLFYKILSAELDKKVKLDLRLLWHVLKPRVFNLQKQSRAFLVGEQHYDRGNDLYKCMLDRRMTYSSGWWEGASDLDEAQEAKLKLVCMKIGLRAGMKVLDIGCGWGSFAKYAAQEFGAEVVGITVSQQQVELGRQLCAGLPVEIRLQDYRDLEGRFDHVVSLGMFEHVGYRNYRTYMEVVHRSLKDDGVFLLQTIGRNSSGATIDPWMAKYLFPNSMLPSVKQVAAASEGLFVMEDWQNFGTHYDRTLMAWLENFDANWHKLASRYDERFCRMWKYYLCASAGAFRARRNQLWQIVFSKSGLPGGYRSPYLSRGLEPGSSYCHRIAPLFTLLRRRNFPE